MNNHTQGPWNVAEQTQSTNRIVCADDGFSAVCCCYGTILTESADHEFNQRRDANARLIAAAPDMLDALLKAYSALEKSVQFQGDLPFWRTGGDGYEAMQSVGAAIAKATP